MIRDAPAASAIRHMGRAVAAAGRTAGRRVAPVVSRGVAQVTELATLRRLRDDVDLFGSTVVDVLIRHDAELAALATRLERLEAGVARRPYETEERS